MNQSFKCPICRDTSAPAALCPVTLGYQTAFDLIECQNCGTRMLDPIPTDEQLETFYSPHYYGSDWYKQRGMGMAFTRSFLKRLPPGKFLDVGCGLGYFIDGIRQNSDWDVCGVEFSNEAVEYARQNLNLDVRQGELADVNFPEQSFDFVRVWNVLEHVKDPLSLLKEVRRIIKPDGLFHLSVPSGYADSGGLIKFYNLEGKPARSKDGHLFFFSKKALLQMFDETNFEIIKSGTIGMRRGMTNLGLFPRKPNWKTPYFLRDFVQNEEKKEISLPPEKKRPDFYYRYRYFRMNVKTIPGLREIGLDFSIMLKPK